MNRIMGKSSLAGIMSFLAAFGLLLVLAAPAWCASGRQVLLLNSYHQGFRWTDEVTRGVFETLGTLPGVEMHVEYMDAKRHESQAHAALLVSLYKGRYGGVPLDVVLTTDDPALRFALQHRDALFPGATIVFCGANNITEAALAGYDNVVGVAEEPDMEAGIALALRLHPDTHTVVAVVDDTMTGRMVQEYLARVGAGLPAGVKLEVLTGPTVPDMLARVSALGPGNLLYLTIYNRDGAGTFYEYDAIPRMLAAATALPVYCAWDFSLGYGPVGGLLTSGYEQGLAAGRLAMRVAGGDSKALMPLINRSPNRYLFDYAQLLRLRIALGKLPPESTFINRPVTFYEQYRALVWVTCALFAALSGFTFSLWITVQRRKRAEAALARSEAKYRGIFEQAGEGIFRSTLEGKFLTVNPAMAHMLGYASPEDLMVALPESARALYEQPEERDRYVAAMRQRGVVQDFEVCMRRADGASVWVNMNSHLVTAEDGKGVIIEGMMADITARKKAEMSLQLLNAGLEERVAQRTWELAESNAALQQSMESLKATQQQLVQREKMAALGQLVAGVAHEVNTPVGVCITSASYIAEMLTTLQNLLAAGELRRTAMDKLLHDIRNAVDIVLGNLDRTARLVATFRQLSVNQVVEVPRNIDVCAYLHDVGTHMLALLGTQGHTLRVECDRGMECVTIPGVLTEVLTIFLTNTLEHAFAAGVHGNVVLAAVRTDAGVRISYEDDGVGMDASVREQAFEPFFTTRRHAGSSGLGLHIAYNLCTAKLGGDVWCESAPGKGVRFVLTLPSGQESVSSGLAPQPPVH